MINGVSPRLLVEGCRDRHGVGLGVVDGQSLVCSAGVVFKPRVGYATDGLPRKLKSPSKAARNEEDDHFMASLRKNPDKGHLILDREKYNEDEFKEKLEKAPKKTGDPMIDRIIQGLREYYKDEE